MAKSILVKVTKNGEVLEVNPGTLEAHKRFGWLEVKEEVKVLPLELTKLTPEQVIPVADALNLSAAGGSEEKKEGGDPALQDAANQPRRTGKK